MNNIEADTTSAEQLESAKQQMEAAHETYSTFFHRREDCEQSLATCAARRAAMVRELKQTQRSLETQMHAAIQQAIENPASADSSKVMAARAKCDLLKRSIQKLAAFEYADLERALLVAKIDELASQKVFEESRVTHQHQSVLMSLVSTMDLAGDLALDSLGSVTAGMERLAHEVGVHLGKAQGELREHDVITASARTNYEKDQSTWVR
jgi:hypothetical protein